MDNWIKCFAKQGDKTCSNYCVTNYVNKIASRIKYKAYRHRISRAFPRYIKEEYNADFFKKCVDEFIIRSLCYNLTKSNDVELPMLNRCKLPLMIDMVITTSDGGGTTATDIYRSMGNMLLSSDYDKVTAYMGDILKSTEYRMFTAFYAPDSYDKVYMCMAMYHDIMQLGKLVGGLSYHKNNSSPPDNKMLSDRSNMLIEYVRHNNKNTLGVFYERIVYYYKYQIPMWCGIYFLEQMRYIFENFRTESEAPLARYIGYSMYSSSHDYYKHTDIYSLPITPCSISEHIFQKYIKYFDKVIEELLTEEKYMYPIDKQAFIYRIISEAPSDALKDFDDITKTPGFARFVIEEYCNNDSVYHKDGGGMTDFRSYHDIGNMAKYLMMRIKTKVGIQITDNVFL